MICLTFFVGDPISFDGEWEDREGMEDCIRAHLGIEDRDRYEVHCKPDEIDPTIGRVWVEDRVSWDQYDVETLPRYVSPERPRRTVWVNPPSEAERLGDEKSCPWNTHYIEYIQVYHVLFEEKKMYMVKYWKRYEEVEMYDPTPLARARYAYLAEGAQGISPKGERMPPCYAE